MRQLVSSINFFWCQLSWQLVDFLMDSLLGDTQLFCKLPNGKCCYSIIFISRRGPERLVGICIDKGYKFPLNQCFKAYLFFIFNSLKCLGIDNKSNLYSPRKVICSQLIGDTCFIYLVTSGSILTR